ncbi:GNAT family N-acetyltransferase [Providencia huaxiensis]|uniref:GNAT family N-acetyltransferase n=1 Tax=Providencia huaxiensis TaxID=2027290 RepID=UPI0034DD5FAA
MVHLVLFADQQPVSTLTMTFNNETARLDDIGTDIQYQGKGLATSLIKHALYLCHQQGIKQCVLESSSEGLSIYKNWVLNLFLITTAIFRSDFIECILIIKMHFTLPKK